MVDKYIIRTSDRYQFRKCRQLWDFTSKLRQNWEYQPGIEALDFGTAIHAGLEHYYDPMTWGQERVQQSACTVAFAASMGEWKRRLVAANQWESRADIWNEHNELGRGMLQHYFEHYADEKERYRPVRSEVEFEVPIPYPPEFGDMREQGIEPNADFELLYKWKPVVYQGRIDLIVEDLRDERLWILDHKTAAQFGQTEHLELDPQCKSYSWAAKKMLGLDIAGVIYSELRKKVPNDPVVLNNGTLSKNKNQGTTVEKYKAKIAELGQDASYYFDFLETLKESQQEYFRRIEVVYAGYELGRQERDIILEALDMIDNPRIYPNPSRWNCNGCQFRSPCLMLQDGSDAEWHLKNSGLYIRRGNSD